MQRQLAIKIMIILVIGAAILIPVTMVKSKIYERQQYLQQAKNAVAQSWTGPQLVLTPVIIIPYQTVYPSTNKAIVNESGFYTPEQTKTSNRLHAVLPLNTNSHLQVSNSSVFKGIYEIPVYNSNIELSGQFSASALKEAIAKIQNTTGFTSIGNPYFSLHISDVRGINISPQLTFNNTSIPFEPGSQIPELNSGLHAELPRTLFEKWLINSTEETTIEPSQSTASANNEFNVSITLRGMGSLSFISLANNANVTMISDWPHPEFIGAALPTNRTISAKGFKADWASTRYSNNSIEGFKQCVEKDQCHSLNAASSGVNFIEPVDVYLQSERSVKYAMLFIGLSFITFFIFEHIKSVRIHPIQYAFVGLATAVFYLLLISLAEHIAFHWAYLMAVICCSSLLLFYVKYMLRNALSALLFALMMTLLYGLLYVIVQAEDFALLMGSLLVFIVLSTLMVITRKIDWYALSTQDVKTDLNTGQAGHQ